jgi:AbrB family looped-hinge helix DNA binding protein
MARDIITIDKAGRVVIPIGVRRRFGLRRGARLRIRELGSRIMLEPVQEASRVEEKRGLYVVHGRIGVRDSDHRSAREGRLDRLTPTREGGLRARP